MQTVLMATAPLPRLHLREKVGDNNGGTTAPVGRCDGVGFNGTACETDFGGTKIVHDGAMSATAPLNIVSDSPCHAATKGVNINDEGFTSFGEKTNQTFTQTPRMKTKGLHIFVNFLKLGDLE